jgi:hypothetical protein
MTFDVDVPAMRGCASALAEAGARVVAGAANAPPAVAVPRWSASDAATTAADAARRTLGALGAGIAAAGDLVGSTADDYRAADDRAARRLRSLR